MPSLRLDVTQKSVAPTVDEDDEDFEQVNDAAPHTTPEASPLLPPSPLATPKFENLPTGTSVSRSATDTHQSTNTGRSTRRPPPPAPTPTQRRQQSDKFELTKTAQICLGVLGVLGIAALVLQFLILFEVVPPLSQLLQSNELATRTMLRRLKADMEDRGVQTLVWPTTEGRDLRPKHRCPAVDVGGWSQWREAAEGGRTRSFPLLLLPTGDGEEIECPVNVQFESENR